MNMGKVIIWIDSALKFCRIAPQMNSVKTEFGRWCLKKGQWSLIGLGRMIDEDPERGGLDEKDQ